MQRPEHLTVPEEDAHIYAWLYPEDGLASQYLQRYEPGTCEWFLISDAFAEWRSTGSRSRSLVVCGKPGCGKTTLSSLAVRSAGGLVQGKSGHHVVEFFFAINDPQRGTVAAFLASFMLQLCLRRQELPSEVRELHRRSEDGTRRPTENDLKSVLLSLLPASRHIFLVVDAPEECRASWMLAELLGQLCGLATCRISLFVSCGYSWALRYMGDFERHAVIPPGEVTRDIKLVVEKRRAEYQILNGCDHGVVDGIMAELIEGAGDMFTWAVGQLDALRSCSSESQARETLRRRPPCVDHTFFRALYRVPEEERSIAFSLLQWLAFSARQMSVEELAETTLIDVGAGRFDHVHVADIREFLESSTDLSTCEKEGFVCLADQSELERSASGTKMEFIHPSAREYLVSSTGVSVLVEVDSHRCLAEACLVYLLEVGLLPEDASFSFPLLEYASLYWVWHYRQVPRHLPGPRLIGLFKQFLTALGQPTFRSRLGAYDERTLIQAIDKTQHFEQDDIFYWEEGIERSSRDENVRSLYWASMIGHPDAVRLALGLEPVSSLEEMRLGVQVAARLGDAAVVALLLDQHLDHQPEKIAATDGGAERTWFEDAFVGAAARGHCDVLRLLVDKLLADGGISDEETRKRVLEKALRSAAWTGGEAACRLLLEAGADAAAQSPVWYLDSIRRPATALQAAALGGDVATVRLLLDAGAPVNVGPMEGTGGNAPAALPYACGAGHRDVVELLIERGADINARAGGRNGGALHQAARSVRADIVRLLLDHGADMELSSGDFATPLKSAIAPRLGDDHVVRLLLDAGADINAVGTPQGPFGSDETPLALAAGQGRESTVRLLLERGADTNLEAGYYGTALHTAIAAENARIVKLLIDGGARLVDMEVDIIESDVGWAACKSTVEIVKILLDAGAAPTRPDGRSILHLAACFGRADMVRFLVERGLDVDTRTDRGRTPLHDAAMNGRGQVVKVLVTELKADIMAATVDRKTVLHRAASRNQPGVVHLLLDLGADIEAQTTSAATALFIAAWRGHEEVVRVLLARGARTETGDEDGYTPLHGAACKGHTAVVKELLDGGADVAALTCDGWPALHLAARDGHGEVARLLMEHGADPETKGGPGCGDTALAFATMTGQAGIVELLIDHGAVVNDGGESLLQLAARSDQPEVCLLLLQHGVSFTRIQGTDVMSWALFRRHWALARLLLELGVEFKVKRLMRPERSLSVPRYDTLLSGLQPCRHGRSSSSEDGRRAKSLGAEARGFWAPPRPVSANGSEASSAEDDY